MGSPSQQCTTEVEGVGAGGRGGTAIEEPSVLHRIRNMWQFANLCQWIYLFGKAVKVDDNMDIDELEADCLNPRSPKLLDVGLALLKALSSHRGLTLDLFDEYARRQFVSKAPDKNPFGEDEAPARFVDLDVFTKIRVLQQMTQWIMMYPERIREKTEEQKDIDQTSWRIEPCGWDADDRTYFILDDNRIYRMSEAPLPLSPLAKKKTKRPKKTYRLGSRSSKRRRVSHTATEDDTSHVDDNEASEDGGDEVMHEAAGDDSLGGMKWECIAVTLDQVHAFLQTIQRTRDANEKTLRSQIEDHLVPILEKQEESRRRKEQQRERELLNLAKMANAKRSSRIASRAETQRAEELAREEDGKRQEEAAAARKAELQRLRLEKDRDLRLMSREKRLKEREARRLQHEEELAQLSDGSRNTTASGRLSERRLQQEIDKNKQALKELQDEEDDWMFDCVCGVYGRVDDGTHSIACEACSVWQHSKCMGVNEDEAERPEFHFVCASCRRREQAEQAPERRRTVIKIKPNTASKPSVALDQATTSPPRAVHSMGHSRIVIPLPRRAVAALSATDDAPVAKAAADGLASIKSRQPDTTKLQLLNGNGHGLSQGNGVTRPRTEPLEKGHGSVNNGNNVNKPGEVELPNGGMSASSITGSTPSRAPVLGHPAVTPTAGQTRVPGESSNALPPPSISPIKSSPPVLQRQPALQAADAETGLPKAGVVDSQAPPVPLMLPVQTVAPPKPVLRPVAHEQVLTPPIKHAVQTQPLGGSLDKNIDRDAL